MAGGNNTLGAAVIMPPDGAGDEPNKIYYYTPDPTYFMNIAAIISDNEDPTHVVHSGSGERVHVAPNTYTGRTTITDGSTVVKPGSGFGTGPVEVWAPTFGVTKLRIENTEIPNDMLLVPGTVDPIRFEMTGIATISGKGGIKNNSESNLDVIFNAPGSNFIDMLVGDWSVVGTGNAVTGEQGFVVLGFTGDGTHIINGNLNDPKMKVEHAAAVLEVNGKLPDTTATGNPSGSQTVRGTGEIESFKDLDNFPSDGFDLLMAPGASIGTIAVQKDMLIRNSDFTYTAEIDDAGNSDRIAVGRTLDISTPTDTLDIQFFTGSTLADATYTLATYGTLVGAFSTVLFGGNAVADPTLPGAIGGTHQLIYGPTALLLTTGPLPLLPGDYNNDGSVDAADYVVWRKSDGTPAGYDKWRANFGASLGLGSGSMLLSTEPLSRTVPEPSMVVLLTFLMAPLFFARRRRRGQK
jgi:hypothetical protein